MKYNIELYIYSFKMFFISQRNQKSKGIIFNQSIYFFLNLNLYHIYDI
jgi:hypothetical protein